MQRYLITALFVISASIGITSCASDGASSPYGDPDAQRERAKDAQDEMRRDTSRY